ncbi:MAG: FAD-dependent oxidoreductase, partial [Sphingomicrobium sp.]
MSQQHSPVYWIDTCSPPQFPQLEGEIDVDVAIIGGGIVGVSAARFLKDQGMTVALVEARRVGQGVSGKATAKV